MNNNILNQTSQTLTWYSAKAILALSHLSPTWRRSIWRHWYQFLAKNYQQAEWRFMNYGYQPLDKSESTLDLRPDDEPNRYWIQLYHHLVQQVPLKDKTVLEVSSGRGGGADYVARYLKPARMVGLDLADQASLFCQQLYPTPNLSFMTGDATRLPFADNSVDVILNVEASHCYPSMPDFLRHVSRILRPNGYLLHADIRLAKYVPIWEKHLQRTDLTLISQVDITPQVLLALQQCHQQKQSMIDNNIHPSLRRLFETFAGQQGSQVYKAFETGDMVYLSFVLQKP